MNSDKLSEESKEKIRKCLVIESERLIGIPYDLGAEWIDILKPPIALDCSEMIEGLYKMVKLSMPDGSQAQFNATEATVTPKIGDLAFFGKGADPAKIYHVGMIFSDTEIIEARAYDPSASFETGKVILRPIEKWKTYKNFVGFRVHPKLA